jgi:drug/metabolite transporter (DMT)-like permease
MIQNPFDDS